MSSGEYDHCEFVNTMKDVLVTVCDGTIRMEDISVPGSIWWGLAKLFSSIVMFIILFDWVRIR